MKGYAVNAQTAGCFGEVAACFLYNPFDQHPLLFRECTSDLALSAAQITSIADSITAQRRGIDALKAQLSSFDEQLAVLEQVLGPLAEWASTWADLEQRLLNIGPRPEAGR